MPGVPDYPNVGNLEYDDGSVRIVRNSTSLRCLVLGTFRACEKPAKNCANEKPATIS